MRAALLGDTATVVRLLSDGAPAGYASVLGNSNMTSLMWAAAEGHAQIAEALVQAGADVNTVDSNNTSALLFAAENLPNMNPRKAPPSGFPGRKGAQPSQTPVKLRVTGHNAIIRLLLDNGAELSVTNAFKETLLHMVARKAQLGLVREFALRGIGMETKSAQFEETALHVAAKEGHADVVSLLCELGANTESKSRFGWTPLIWAASSGWESAVRELISRGADVNVRVGEGSESTSALKEARKCSRPQSISKLLISAGAIE